MKNAVLRVVGFASLAFMVSQAASAATYVVPTDRAMVDWAQAIVVGTVETSYYAPNGRGGTERISTIRVEETLKGSVGDRVSLVEIGNVYNGIEMPIAGVPKYEPGERVLVFLLYRKDGRWGTLNLELGKFTFGKDIGGREMLIRGYSADAIFGWDIQGNRWTEYLRVAKPFLDFIRDVVARRQTTESYRVEFKDVELDRSHAVARPGAFTTSSTSGSAPPHPAFLPANYTFQSGGKGIRRDFSEGTVTYQRNGDQTNADAGGDTGIAAGLDAWNDDPSSTVDLALGPTTTASGGVTTPDETNTVLFNDPNGEITGSWVCGSGGVLGLGGFTSATSACSDYGGSSFWCITEGDVVIQDGIDCWSGLSGAETDFKALLAHELGHSIGFRHANRNPDDGACGGSDDCVSCEEDGGSEAALMCTVLVNGLGATLEAWDQRAVQTVYGAGSVCSGPTINTHPAGKTIGGGQSASLSVSATASEGSLSYKWYAGNSGDTSGGVLGTSSSISVTPGSTTKYWVEVRDTCSESGANPKNSNAATVTVVCNPTITTQPSNKTITSGQSTTLSVTSSQATGYEWYQGTSGDTGSGILGTSSSFNTGTLTATTQFWVKVKTSCGSTSSNTATVTVTAPCTNVSLPASEPVNQSITSGSSATITVTASAGTPPITYRFYQGACCSTSNLKQSGTSNSYTTPALTSTTQYWVRATNCTSAYANSRTATITVASSCTAPTITTHPASQTAPAAGQTVTLSVSATGTSLSYQWYAGASGTTTSPVSGGTSTSINVAPTSTTQYWVRVTNSCGTKDSNAATVTVQSSCVEPTITTHPASKTSPGAGQIVTLSVQATGTSLTYQWYIGSSGDASTPIGGATSSSVSVSPTTTTEYWVRLTNACGTADSNTATLTVPGSCIPLSIKVQPTSATLLAGQQWILQVFPSGTGPYSYQWYIGEKGDTSNPIASSNQYAIAVTVKKTTKYWVRVFNPCGFLDSDTATLTVDNTRRRAVRRP